MLSDLVPINSQKTKKEYDVTISLLKVIAMFLIINSHADILFPNKLRFIATGGALGNELFFFVGGLLFRSRDEESFASFAWRKYIRLYLPTYIMTAFLFAIGYIHFYEFTTARDIFHLLIWPSQFWFVSAIFAMTILMYVLQKTVLFEEKVFIGYSIIFLFALFVFYSVSISDKTIWIVEDARVFGTTVYFKCFYSFYVFTLGYFISKRNNVISSHVRIISIFGFLISFLAFYLFKYLLNKSIVPMEFQILSQPITVLCVVCLYLSIKNMTIVRNATIINSLGSITLESFLVQFQVIQRIQHTAFSFPINYVIAIIIVVSISFVFHSVNELLCKSILKRLPRK